MTSEQVSRRILIVAAWWMLSMIVLAFLSLAIPAVSQFLAAPAPGSVAYLVTKLLTAATGIVLIGGWFATIWHAAVNPLLQSVGQRAVVIVLIVLGSAISPFVYYFAYLRWALRRAHAVAAA
jgi:hypothetical protein